MQPRLHQETVFERKKKKKEIEPQCVNVNSTPDLSYSKTDFLITFLAMLGAYFYSP